MVLPLVHLRCLSPCTLLFPLVRLLAPSWKKLWHPEQVMPVSSRLAFLGWVGCFPLLYTLAGAGAGGRQGETAQRQGLP